MVAVSDANYDAQYPDARIGPPLGIHIQGLATVLYIGRNPSIKQWAFLDRQELEQLYGGSKSGGKSIALCLKIITYCMAFAGNRVGLFRKDLTDLKGSTLVTFFKVCPSQLIRSHHKTDRLITFINGTTLHYSGLGDIHEVESAKGKEFGAFAIDEPSEIEMETYLQLLAQLRWVLPNGANPSYQAWLGSNPEPGWLEDHFGHLISVATESEPIVTDGQRCYIMALPKDNPYLPRNWEEILRSQTDIPETWIKKYLEGSWEASEGQVFKEFDRRTHCVSIRSISSEYLHRLTLVGVLDHATTGVVNFSIIGVDPKSNIIVLASYYAKNKLISDHAQGIKDLVDAWVKTCGKEEQVKSKTYDGDIVYPGFHAFEYVLIDPSTQAKTLQNKNEMWSVQDAYLREGIPTIPAWNALESGIRLLEEYVHVKEKRINPFTGEKGSPSLFVVKEYNAEGIKEMTSWRRTITLNKTIRYVGADHWIDCLRYCAMSRPEPPEFVGRKLGIIDTLDAKAQADLAAFDKKFGNDPNSNQWFPGGTGGKSTSNQWFGRVN